MTRVESPSSINVFNQCKRKYYYSYKLNLPRKESIHTITGKAVHNALENFFNIDTLKIDESNYDTVLMHHLLNLFNISWTNSLKELLKLENGKETIISHYKESLYMLQNFIDDFLNTLKNKMKSNIFHDAFNSLKPEREIYLYSEKHNVHGYLDVMLRINDEIFILDYKTGNKNEITEDYMLQLAIYALLFNENYGKLPNKVGLYFLRHGTKKYLEVNYKLLDLAKKECELVKLNTISDDMKDYDKNPGPLCKWKEGQCSFYEYCFGIKKLDDFGDKNISLAEVKGN